MNRHLTLLLFLALLTSGCGWGSQEEDPNPADPPSPSTDDPLAAEADAVDRLRGSGATVSVGSDQHARSVEADGLQLDEEDFRAIGRLSRLEKLSLEETNVTDADLSHVSGLSNLKLLNLNQTAVGDEGLARLEGLSSLEWLRLKETGVTDAGVERLKQALSPECVVER